VIIAPSNGYIRECLRAGIYPADSLTIDLLARSINAIPVELAVSLLGVAPAH